MFSLVDMQDQLKEDANGTKKREIVDKILTEKQQLQNLSNKGLSSEDFETVDKLIKACDAAKKAVEGSWDFYQKQKKTP